MGGENVDGMVGYTRRIEIKWLVIGLVLGLLGGYAQGSGMIDFLALLPI